MSHDLGLNPHLLRAAFPFHFAVNRDLIVVQHGPSLQRMLAEPLVDGSMAALFEIDTPKPPPHVRGARRIAAVVVRPAFQDPTRPGPSRPISS